MRNVGRRAADVVIGKKQARKSKCRKPGDRQTKGELGSVMMWREDRLVSPSRVVQPPANSLHIRHSTRTSRCASLSAITHHDFTPKSPPRNSHVRPFVDIHRVSQFSAAFDVLSSSGSIRLDSIGSDTSLRSDRVRFFDGIRDDSSRAVLDLSSPFGVICFFRIFSAHRIRYSIDIHSGTHDPASALATFYQSYIREYWVRPATDSRSDQKSSRAHRDEILRKETCSTRNEERIDNEDETGKE